MRDHSLRLSDLVTATGKKGFTPQTCPDGQCSALPTVDTGHTTSGALVFAQANLGRYFTLSGQPDQSSSTGIDITV